MCEDIIFIAMLKILILVSLLMLIVFMTVMLVLSITDYVDFKNFPKNKKGSKHDRSRDRDCDKDDANNFDCDFFYPHKVEKTDTKVK